MSTLPSCSEYICLIETPGLIKVPELIGGRVERAQTGKPKRYTGGFCIVFPYCVGQKKYAIRCWHTAVDKAQERTKIVSDFLKTIDIPYFVDFRYCNDGIATQKGIVPIVVMDWVAAVPLKEYIKSHLNNQNALIQLGRNFFEMAAKLRSHNVSHGDLQHGNILVKDNGSVVLVDYDSMYVPGLDGYEDEVKGLKGYQHPARWKNTKVNPKADYFSELIIYASIMALSRHPELWKSTRMENSDWMLFSDEDLDDPDSANIFSKLEEDPELKGLSHTIKDFLKQDSIDSLLPLEEAVMPPKTLTERISERWRDNGYVPQPEIDPADEAERISRRWRSN